MQPESLGKVLPRILFPYVHQWAERSGYSLLSRLLVDEQFRGLVEKYGDEMSTRMAQASYTPGNENGRRNGKKPATQAEPVSETDANANELTKLQERVLAMEAQQQVQQVLFEVLRTRIRPLALALGCCPECLVGVEGCPKCWGASTVAHYPPDYELLEAQIVSPLAARGVPLILNKRNVSVSATGRQSRKSTATRKRSRPWPKK